MNKAFFWTIYLALLDNQGFANVLSVKTNLEQTFVWTTSLDQQPLDSSAMDVVDVGRNVVIEPDQGLVDPEDSDVQGNQDFFDYNGHIRKVGIGRFCTN